MTIVIAYINISLEMLNVEIKIMKSAYSQDVIMNIN